MPAFRKMQHPGAFNRINTVYVHLFSLQAKMGYKEGTGLGKHEQGRVNIVEASLQRGRRGLGLNLKGLEPSMDVEWREEDDKVRKNNISSSGPSCSKLISC